MDMECFNNKIFCMEKAEKLAKLAKLAYEHETCWQHHGFDSVVFFDNDGAQAFGAVKDDHIFLCFRGTEPDQLNDIIADAKIWHKEAEFAGCVHTGFAEELDKLWFDIRFWIKDLSDKQLWVTGHSLGAAMATVATSRLGTDTICYNYGSPRVGDRYFQRQFNASYELHRFVNNNDVVCRIPMELLRYKHVGHEHYMNMYGFVRTMTRWQRIKDKMRGILASLKKFKFLDGLQDHGMKHYCKNLTKIVAEEKSTG